MKKTITILLIISLLLIESVFANFDADFISGITDEQINAFVIPRIDTRFFWEDNNLKVKVNYQTIQNTNEHYEYFETLDQEFYPEVNIKDFYTCLFEAQQKLESCINYLVYSEEPITYEEKTYYSMRWQVNKRINSEKNKIKKYREQIRYNKIMNDIITELE